ncbi:MAG TPA: hypothetical protein VF657_10290 [Actinoplanes sp.]
MSAPPCSTALRRCDVDLEAAIVRVPRKLAVLVGRVEFGPPKSAAGVRESMHRMGHSTMRAALIYQHATSERDQEIASAMDGGIAGKRGSEEPKPPDGTAG